MRKHDQFEPLRGASERCSVNYSSCPGYPPYYVLDHIGFIDHGSSVPGWLTDDGKGFVADIDELERNGELE